MAARIFVVDDDPSVRRAVGRLLRSADYDVSTFASATEALPALASGVPDCLIIDLRMPRIDGLELFHTVRRTCDVPVIFISGHADDETVARAMEAGVRAIS